MQELETGLIDLYICSVCAYVYDEESAERDTEFNMISFENLDPDWACPNCGATPDLFKKEKKEPWAREEQ